MCVQNVIELKLENRLIDQQEPEYASVPVQHSGCGRLHLLQSLDAKQVETLAERCSSQCGQG